MPKLDFSALDDGTTASGFMSAFKLKLAGMSNARNLNERLLDINSAIRSVAVNTIPQVPSCRKKPWISNDSLGLIQLRSFHRHLGNYDLEQATQKQLKIKIKSDKQRWLDDTLENGNWKSIKNYKRRMNRTPRTNQIRDAHGKMVDNHLRSETMATYFEKIQWAVRPDCVVNNLPPLFDNDLNVPSGQIAKQELRQVIKKIYTITRRQVWMISRLNCGK